MEEDSVAVPWSSLGRYPAGYHTGDLQGAVAQSDGENGDKGSNASLATPSPRADLSGDALREPLGGSAAPSATKAVVHENQMVAYAPLALLVSEGSPQATNAYVALPAEAATRDKTVDEKSHTRGNCGTLGGSVAV